MIGAIFVKFSQLVLVKIIEIVATRCQILRLKSIKFNFAWGSIPDPAGRAYSAPSDHLAGFKRPTSTERGGKEGSGGRGRLPATFFLQINAHECRCSVVMSSVACMFLFVCYGSNF